MRRGGAASTAAGTAGCDAGGRAAPAGGRRERAAPAGGASGPRGRAARAGGRRERAGGASGRAARAGGRRGRAGGASGNEITAEPNGAMWRFAVQDNGISIEPQFEEKIFVIFQRLHPRDVYPGTGIGLAICKRIVEHHGGRIWLDASYTSGARICFTLPAPPPVTDGEPGLASVTVASPAPPD
ncbi:sensor histidine kinase [Dactylosporangium sp. CA-092794]|uniref:sensor histidine kinase n=1 Tax=Dactylosporangium sp. CA-092794 TaxID=3239929 RepID=UPI003D919BF0